MDLLSTPFGRAYYLQSARDTIKNPKSSDDDILAACEVLRAWGDWCDQQMSDSAEMAVRSRVMEAENIEFYKLATWLCCGVAAWGLIAVVGVAITGLIW